MITFVGLLQWGGDTLSVQKEEPSVGVTFDFSRTQFTSRKRKGRQAARGERPGRGRSMLVAVSLQRQGEAMAPY